MGRKWQGWVVLDGEGELVRFAAEMPPPDLVLRVLSQGWIVVPAQLRTTDWAGLRVITAETPKE